MHLICILSIVTAITSTGNIIEVKELKGAFVKQQYDNYIVDFGPAMRKAGIDTRLNNSTQAVADNMCQILP